MFFSVTISKKLNSREKGVGKGMLEFNHTTLDPIAGTITLKWIAGNNITKPHELTTEALKITDFTQLVMIYQATPTLKINRHLRSDNVPNANAAHIKTGKITEVEFALVIDRLSFDRRLVKSMKHCVVYKAVKGGKDVVPHLLSIKAHCKEVGLSDEMLTIEKGIQESMQTQKAKDEEKKKQEPEVRFQLDFPTLA